MDAGNSGSARTTKPRPTAARSKYAPRACQECRRRRAKCDGQKPACARCLSRGKSCVFTSEADNRGTAPKSYVDLLHARIKLLEQVLWLHSIDIDSSVAQLNAQRTDGGEESEAPVAAYSSSLAFNELCEQFEGALYLEDPLDENGPTGGEARFFGQSSGRLELQISEPDSTEFSLIDSSPSCLGSSPSAADDFSLFSNEHGQTSKAGFLIEIISPELKEHLTALYFEWEQPWLQVVDERLFRQSEQDQGRYYSLFLHYSILAIGSRYSDQPEVRANHLDPNSAGRIFSEQADRLLQRDIRTPNITTVQALAVLGMYHVASGSERLGWLYHGMANRLLLDMGFNVDTSALTGSRGNLSRDEIQLRRQIYWSLYCNDKLWASYTGRVCTMPDSQSSLSLPSVQTLDENRPSIRHQRAYLPQLLRATSTHSQILEKILMNLYAPKRLSSAMEKHTFFDSCILTLKGWYYSLPSDFKVKGIGKSTDLPALPHAYVLNMVYHTSIILLAKPFLHSRRAETSFGVAQHGEQGDLALRALNLCHESAGTICLLGERYRGVFGSFRRSPLTATHCTLTAALVTMFVSPSKAGASKTDLRHKLEGCMTTLRELSVSWAPPLRYWQTLNKIRPKQWPRSSDNEYPGTPSSQNALPSLSTPSANVLVDVAAENANLTGKIQVTAPSETQASSPSLTNHPPGLETKLFHTSDQPTTIPAIGTAEPWFAPNAQIFSDMSFLDVGAFDAFSWDCTETSEFDIQPQGDAW